MYNIEKYVKSVKISEAARHVYLFYLVKLWKTVFEFWITNY